MYDLKDCTFKPQINNKTIEVYDPSQSKNMDKQVWERLHEVHIEAQENKIRLEREKQEKELRGCTFSPQINNRRSMYFEDDGTDPYTRLYERHIEYAEAKKQKEIEKQQKEIAECSFKPNRITKKKDKQFNLVNQRSIDHFEKLYHDGRRGFTQYTEEPVQEEMAPVQYER